MLEFKTRLPIEDGRLGQPLSGELRSAGPTNVIIDCGYTALNKNGDDQILVLTTL